MIDGQPQGGSPSFGKTDDYRIVAQFGIILPTLKSPKQSTH
jgi:hypothetical protein